MSPRVRADVVPAAAGFSEAEAWFALNSVDGLGAAALLRLSRRFGSPREAMSASGHELVALGRITLAQADQIHSLASNPTRLQRQARALRSRGIRFLPCSHTDYPTSLHGLRTPPPLLYVKGSLRRDDARAIAIVGTRTPTASGARLARQFASAAARAGWAVVSGLARGIDTTAHEAALAAGGRTIAVLGCGLSQIYPPENTALASAICRQGCLIAEVPPWSRVSRAALLARDRIQAGLSLATVVVQAHESCGSIVTAKHALACGRALFTVPWECEPYAAGWERLRQMGAHRVNSADDLLRLIARLEAGASPSRSRLF